MSANWNWLQGLRRHADEPDRAQAMSVFSGQNLVVGRQREQVLPVSLRDPEIVRARRLQRKSPSCTG